MNRGTLNSSPLGAGSRGGVVRALITGVLELSGTLSASVTKYSSATTDHVLSGVLHSHQWSASSAIGVHELLGSVVGRSLRPVYGSAVQFHSAVSSVFGRREVSSFVIPIHILENTISPTYWRAVFGSAVSELRLEGYASGVDLNYEPAPSGRRSVVFCTPRRVSIAGSDNRTGV